MKILCDIDGCVADFVGTLESKLGCDAVSPSAWDLDERYPGKKKEIFDICSNPKTYYNLSPLNNAIWGVSRLLKMGNAVTFYTSRPTDLYVTEKWLDHYFRQFFPLYGIKREEKVEFAHKYSPELDIS